MHFFCKCGKRISDSTDYLSYKAHMISDQDWFDLWDNIYEVIEKSGPTQNDKEKAIVKIMQMSIQMETTIYQCTKCGKLIFDGKNKFEMYKSSSGYINKGLLQSYKGEQWEGYLHAEWSDKKPEWRETNGYILQNVNFKSSKIRKNIGYNDWENIEKDYFIVFNEFKEKGIIRSSMLKKNDVEIHSWDLKNG